MSGARQECEQVKSNDRNIANGQLFASYVLEEILYQHLPANAFTQAMSAASVSVAAMNDSQVTFLLLTMDKYVKGSDLPEKAKNNATLVNDAVRELAFYRGVVQGEEPVPQERWASYKLG